MAVAPQTWEEFEKQAKRFTNQRADELEDKLNEAIKDGQSISKAAILGLVHEVIDKPEHSDFVNKLQSAAMALAAQQTPRANSPAQIPEARQKAEASGRQLKSASWQDKLDGMPISDNGVNSPEDVKAIVNQFRNELKNALKFRPTPKPTYEPEYKPSIKPSGPGGMKA